MKNIITTQNIPVNQCKKIFKKMQQFNMQKAYIGIEKGEYKIYLLPCQKATNLITKDELQKLLSTQNND
jgi:hypothetical protein